MRQNVCDRDIRGELQWMVDRDQGDRVTEADTARTRIEVAVKNLGRGSGRGANSEMLFRYPETIEAPALGVKYLIHQFPVARCVRNARTGIGLRQEYKS